MSVYGGTIPRRGRELIARLLATGTPLTITRIMMGSGICPDDIFPGDLEDLIEPVAAGTSTEPIYKTDTIHMTLQYRSDLNGGLDHGFWIREFGVFAKDLEGADVMIFYGTLGSYGQWVSAYTSGGVDTREYNISITVGEGATVVIDYSPEAFMTSEDVEGIVTTILFPQFLVRVQELVDTHDQNESAHPFIRGIVSAMDSRLSMLELRYGTDVHGNQFMVNFGDMVGIVCTGVWNTAMSRLEF